MTERSSTIRFDGQVVLVTGAGRGLGAAYARLIASRGAHVVVHDAGVAPDGTGGDRSVAEGVVAEIRGAGGQADATFEDLAARGAGALSVQRTIERLGRLDALVHNAGISVPTPFSELDDRTIDRVLQVNGRAAIEIVQAVLPHMERRSYGRIVLTVSGHGLYPDDGADLVAYAVSKQMQFGLVNALASEAAKGGVLINAISPVAATRMLRREVPAGSLRPEDVAPVVAYLASRACNVAGVVVRAAGGRFSIGRYAVTTGVDLSARGSIEPETLPEAWAEITGGPLDAP